MRPAKKANVNQAPNIAFCRACLATEGKLINMQQHKLIGEFFRVSGIAFNKKDKWPQDLCMWCAALMKRCAAFRAKCLRANQCLQVLGAELNAENIKTIDRFGKQLVDLTRTEIEIDSISSSDSSGMLDIDNLNINNTNDTNTITEVNKDLYMEINSLNSNEIKINIVKEINSNNDEIYDVEYLELSDNDIEPVENNFENDVDYNLRDTDATNDMRDESKSEINVIDVIKRKGGRKPRHFKSAENSFMPKIDLEAFKRNYNVDIFILTHEEQMAEIEARRATKEYQSAPHQCEPCGKYFRDVKAYHHHISKHDEKRGPFECPTCTCRFSWKSKQNTHHDTHRFQFVCRRCRFVCRTRHQAKLHYEWHAGRQYQCKYCGKVFSKLSTYLGHVRLRHVTQNLVCDMCGETFINDKGLKVHRASRHGVARKKHLMKCAACAVTFMSLHALNKHKMAVEQHKMAAGEHEMAAEHGALHACLQCGDTFRAAARLAEHAGAEHPSCQECNATFLSVSSFATHVRRKHRGARTPRLPRPPAAAASRPAAPARPRVCEFCGKMFQSVTLLNYHIKKHRGEKLRFTCELCPKSFFSRPHLEQHMRVHTGEKPYKCDQCSLAFTMKCNLIRHIRAVHLKVNPRFPCPLCGRLFTTKSSVSLHVNTVHAGLPGPKRDRSKRRFNKVDC